MNINILTAFNVNKSVALLIPNTNNIEVQSRDSGGFNRCITTWHVTNGLTRQQLKLAVGLCDTSASTVARYLQPQFINAYATCKGDINKFSESLQTEANPLETALNMLGNM